LNPLQGGLSDADSECMTNHEAAAPELPCNRPRDLSARILIAGLVAVVSLVLLLPAAFVPSLAKAAGNPPENRHHVHDHRDGRRVGGTMDGARPASDRAPSIPLPSLVRPGTDKDPRFASRSRDES
jgi:hypothetical protein